MKVEIEFVGGPRDGERLWIPEEIAVFVAPEQMDDKASLWLGEHDDPTLPDTFMAYKKRVYHLVGINDQGVRRYQFEP